MKEDKEFLISLNDCILILKRAKYKILGFAAATGLLASLYPLLKPISYEAEASFKEKNNNPSGINSNSLASAFFSSLSIANKSEAANMMKSQKLLNRLVQELGLQAALRNQNEKNSYFNTIKSNIIVEWKNWRKNLQIPLKDQPENIQVQQIIYLHEFPITHKLVFYSDNAYEVYDSSDKLIGTGEIGSHFQIKNISYLITQTTNQPLQNSVYSLTLYPAPLVSKRLSKQIKFISDKDDPTLLRLSYANEDRHLASHLLNRLMKIYQNYLKEEQARISSEQLAYLNTRQQEMRDNLQGILAKYADQWASDVEKFGYAQSEKMFEFLTRQLHEYWGKMLAIELEMERKEKPQFDGSPSSILFQQNTMTNTFNSFIDEIRKLKQQGDSLELSLRNSSENDLQNWQNTFEQQVTYIAELRQSISDAQLLLKHLEKEEFPLPQVKLFDHPTYNVKIWNDRLTEVLSYAKFEEWTAYKQQFVTYLEKLLHYLDVNEKTMQERLVHQQAPQNEFQGIDLESSKELYISYNQKLSDLQSQIMQLQFGIEQLQQPGFEVTSLSTVIDDPVTLDMMTNASKLILSYNDDANYSQKEKERIKTEILIQKQFLNLHLTQTSELFKLQESLYKDKIRSLQKASLELIQQQLSIREKDFSDNMELYIANLAMEYDLIKQKEMDIRHEMVNLPKKWASEKIVEHEMKINAAMVEEIAKLVETKNIASNLEMVQSAPLDISVVPTHPVPPGLLAYAVLGTACGLLLSSGYFLTSRLKNGLQATPDNLKIAGGHILGKFSSDESKNRENIRKLINRLLSDVSADGQSLVCIQSHGRDYYQELPFMMEQNGWKVIVLDLNFKNANNSGKSGLLQYLEGTAPEPTICGKEGYDLIVSGGATIYANELLGSKQFIALMDKLKSKYDWIIGFSDADLTSMEAERLVKTFDHSALTIHQETLEDLEPLLCPKANFFFV